MKLFAIYIGGLMKRANIELHDMRFVVAATIEETYDELRRQWWGTPSSLHLDCWSEITRADGYAVTLKRTPPEKPEKLYYVNIGGYDASEFTERHQNIFVVALNESQAKTRALDTVRGWSALHKDNLMEAEQCIALERNAADARYYIHLEKIDDLSPPPFICRYIKIGRKS